MKAPSLIIGSILGMLLSTTASAKPDILPGLWETKIQISSESGQIEQALAQAKAMMDSLPPEQQQMMKDMMASQGVDFDLANRTLKTCLTQAQIDDFELGDTDDGCKQNFVESSKNQFTMTMECPDDNMSGTGELTVRDNKHYSGKMVMNGNIAGQSDVITMQQEASWLSADCGDIAPE